MNILLTKDQKGVFKSRPGDSKGPLLYFTMTSIVYVYYEGLLMKSRNLSFLWFFLRISFYGKFGLKIETHRLPLCVPSPFNSSTHIFTIFWIVVNYDRHVNFLRISFYAKFGLKISTHRLPLCVPSPFKLPCSRIPVPFTVRRPESELPLQPDLR